MASAQGIRETVQILIGALWRVQKIGYLFVDWKGVQIKTRKSPQRSEKTIQIDMGIELGVERTPRV